MKIVYKTLEVRLAASIQWQLAGRLSLQDKRLLEELRFGISCPDSVNKSTKNGRRQVGWILMYLTHS